MGEADEQLSNKVNRYNSSSPFRRGEREQRENFELLQHPAYDAQDSFQLP